MRYIVLIGVAFFLLAFVIALCKLLFMGDVSVFPAIMNSTFETAKTAFEISLGLTGVLSLWMGMMKIGERGGIVELLAKGLAPTARSLMAEGDLLLFFPVFFQFLFKTG